MSAVDDVFDPEKISARVVKGVWFAIDRGFIGKVDPETLDMGKMGKCMLGQGVGEYGNALLSLGISDDEATEMGFQCSDFWALGVKHDEADWKLCPVYLLERREFAALTVAFRKALRDLRASRTVA